MTTRCLYASEIAILTGDNKYQKIYELLLKLWQRHDTVDFNDSVNKIQKDTAQSFSQKENDIDLISRISKENKLDIKDQLSKCLKTQNAHEMVKNRENLIKKAKMLPAELQQEFKQSLNNYTNTMYGIKNEGTAIECFAKKCNKKITCNNDFKKRLLFYNWYLGGRVDGTTEADEIVEIKNRVYKLFHTLREYEKVQIMSYMYIYGTNKGFLVESFSKNDDMQLNVIEVPFDSEYFECHVMRKLEKFSNFYNDFLENNHLKALLLFGQPALIENTIKEILEKY